MATILVSFWLIVISIGAFVAVAWALAWVIKKERWASLQERNLDRIIAQQVITATTLHKTLIQRTLDHGKHNCSLHPERVATAVRGEDVGPDRLQVGAWMCDSCAEDFQKGQVPTPHVRSVPA